MQNADVSSVTYMHYTDLHKLWSYKNGTLLRHSKSSLCLCKLQCLQSLVFHNKKGLECLQCTVLSTALGKQWCAYGQDMVVQRQYLVATLLIQIQTFSQPRNSRALSYCGQTQAKLSTVRSQSYIQSIGSAKLSLVASTAQTTLSRNLKTGVQVLMQQWSDARKPD